MAEVVTDADVEAKLRERFLQSLTERLGSMSLRDLQYVNVFMDGYLSEDTDTTPGEDGQIN